MSQPLTLSVTSGLPLFNASTTVRADTFTIEEWPAFSSARVTPTHFFGIDGRDVSVFQR